MMMLLGDQEMEKRSRIDLNREEDNWDYILEFLLNSFPSGTDDSVFLYLLNIWFPLLHLLISQHDHHHHHPYDPHLPPRARIIECILNPSGKGSAHRRHHRQSVNEGRDRFSLPCLSAFSYCIMIPSTGGRFYLSVRLSFSQALFYVLFSLFLLLLLVPFSSSPSTVSGVIMTMI